ncbi:MAG TPA: hypothetical protein VMW36_08965 [Patescibacteria group bacterium]|nr:hypothetical protein [Patescibacteria group bacterium]
MSTKPEFRNIPAWRPRPPPNRPIGGKTGRFRVLELTIYFDYISDGESQERHFEFTLRIPLTRRNSVWRAQFWEFVASAKMEEVGIHIQGNHWDEGIVGYRYTGRTNAYKPRYVCINKVTKWCMPKSGGWGTLTLWK